MFQFVFLSFLFISLVPLIQGAVPHNAFRSNSGAKLYPETWTGSWFKPGSDLETEITPEMFGDTPDLIQELTVTNAEFKILTVLKSENCFKCRIVYHLHENILAFQVSQCLKGQNFEKLCTKAKNSKKEFLYRVDASPQTPCPSEALTSNWKSYYNISYEEYLTEETSSSSSLVEDCGQPRSELTACTRRNQEDPQFTINLGSCPTSSLVHRQSLTQNFQCIGSWKDEWGTSFVVVKGFEYDYWTEGHYSSISVYRCLAISGEQDDGQIKMSQGFGNDCHGLGAPLNPENGQRRLTLTRVDLDLGECTFPEWVSSTRVWSVIPRAGLRLDMSGESSVTRKVVFPDKLTFTMASKDESGGQRFRCARIISQANNEVTLETFTQSQCYREYHCFHAKLNPDEGLVDLHVGSPTPNIEHACLKPNFDIEVPFLLATIMPFKKDGSSLRSKPQPSQNVLEETISVNQNELEEEEEIPLRGVNSIARQENLKKINVHAISVLRQYVKEQSKKLEDLINGMVHQIKLLYEDQ